MKLGIITGTTRPGNVGTTVGEWVNDNLATRTDVEIQDLKVADFDLDLLNEPTVPGQANGEYDNPKTVKWAEAIKECDAYVFVTAEYNAAPPAALKNAVDLLFVEWTDKPVGFVGYGFGGGQRSIKHWRDIVGNLKMKDAEETVNIFLGEEFPDGRFTPAEGKADDLQKLVDEIAALHGRQ
ncbi:NAD(P)H-dependent oxidoreductase [Corynebacterium freneyi]|uniref:NADPH-dependent FMN reductase n=1 Tax=Corynebacterium freneyi DNF00450 TaxID=1287475 RepID=A0A095ZAR1_9CORY|nr:NAD(P)H-dependent oxidoreductase [Corynebacterium freneyi]KGF15777.1 NADPH-dependent FMN reductase [Corynebacterium freneyi DNF00450]MCG7439908.1 NAD(P)H-dependent oxidoreductase [Corynebacterium freneyi]MDK8769099.1 NAD(P)H-dependent oxidoreductase [Corynebacterium freneyi]